MAVPGCIREPRVTWQRYSIRLSDNMLYLYQVTNAMVTGSITRLFALFLQVREANARLLIVVDANFENVSTRAAAQRAG